MKESFTDRVEVTEELILAEAQHTGDFNPIHIDEAYATQTRFKKRIAHATILVSRISKNLAMDLPGPGTVIVEQNFKFLKPVYIGNLIELQSQVIEKKGKRFQIEHICRNEVGEKVLIANSTVINNSVKSI